MLTLTSAEILELFDVRSPGTLTKWRSLGAGQAVIGRNRWNARAFLEWWLSSIYDGTCGAETDGTLAEARRTYWEARAEGERLKVDREKGAFVPVAEVTREMVAKISLMVAGLRSLPARLSGQLVGKTDRTEISNILSLEAQAMCAVMQKGVPYTNEAAGLAVAELRGMSTEQALAERSAAERTVPIFLKYDPRRKTFTDTRDGTEVPLVEANEYVRKYPYSKPRPESQEDEIDHLEGGSDGQAKT